MNDETTLFVSSRRSSRDLAHCLLTTLSNTGTRHYRIDTGDIGPIRMVPLDCDYHGYIRLGRTDSTAYPRHGNPPPRTPDSLGVRSLSPRVRAQIIADWDGRADADITAMQEVLQLASHQVTVTGPGEAAVLCAAHAEPGVTVIGVIERGPDIVVDFYGGSAQFATHPRRFAAAH